MKAQTEMDTDTSLIRLYILCSVRQELVSSRQICEKLAARGVATRLSSLTRIARALEDDGYLQSGEIGRGRQRQTVYHPTTRGRAAISRARATLRRLLELGISPGTAGVSQ